MVNSSSAPTILCAGIAVQDILLTHLRGLNAQWPKPTYDVAEQRARVIASQI